MSFVCLCVWCRPGATVWMTATSTCRLTKTDSACSARCSAKGSCTWRRSTSSNPSRWTNPRVSECVCLCVRERARLTFSLSLNAVWPLTQPLNSLNSYRRSVSKLMEITNGLQFHFSPSVCLWNTWTDAAVQLSSFSSSEHQVTRTLTKCNLQFNLRINSFVHRLDLHCRCFNAMCTWWWQYF